MINKTQHTIQKAGRRHLARLCLASALFSLSVVPAVATNNDTVPESSSAYIDSVLQWGAWELDIEPAAGGLQPQTGLALSNRNSKVKVRTNSFSALAPPQGRIIVTAPAPIIPQPPVTPPVPVIPTPPPGVGGPADGLF